MLHDAQLQINAGFDTSAAEAADGVKTASEITADALLNVARSAMALGAKERLGGQVAIKSFSLTKLG
eukprot:6193127-Pleurochrysis_carterae.AAC.1